MTTTRTKLWPGDEVIVYEDPHSRKIEEGRARLLWPRQKLSDGYQLWTVSFDTLSPNSFLRTIHPDNKVAAAKNCK